MIFTRLRNLLLAVACIFTGVTAQAQFSGNYEEYVAKDYATTSIDFNFSEVATTLGTDTTTLRTALDAWIADETGEVANMFFLTVGDTLSDNYTQGGKGGFWCNAECVPVTYVSDGTLRWYNQIGYDAQADVFSILIGQYPEACSPEEVFTPKFVLKYGEKQATFDITIKFVARPTYVIPDPASVLESAQNIVGDTTIVVEQYPRGDYSADAIGFPLATAMAKMGLTDRAMIQECLAQLLWATQYNTGDVTEGGGMKKDSLTDVSTAGAPGWWFRAVQNAEGEEDGEVSAAGWGDVDKFFAEVFAYNADNDTLSFNLGQYPGSCKGNEQWFTNIYLIYGDKTFRIKVQLNVKEKEQGRGLADYTKLGENVIVLEQEPTDDYSTIVANIDVDAIATTLGCEVSAMGVTALDDKDNFASSTANNGGWWFNSAGTVTAWGATAAFFIEPATADDWSKLNVGQYPNNLQIGDEVSAVLNFVSGTNYYAQTITLKIVEPKHEEQKFESIETRNFAVQSILYNGYEAQDLITLDATAIAVLLGTESPVLYGLNPDSVATLTGAKYSKKWSCDPKPGFWLAKDGCVSVWGGESPVGICYVDNSILRFFQYPNANSIGDVFKTQLFLVNEETQKMITLNIQLAFVESVIEKEIVGSENIALPVSTEEKTVAIDLDKAATALGVTAADLLDANNYYLRGMKEGIYGEASNCENGLSFDMAGNYDGYGAIYFTIASNDGGYELTIGSNDPVADDYNVSGQFCFEIDNKQYVYYTKFVSESILTGIEQISTKSQASELYDLQGRRVVKAQRGLYIQNGKKIIVK